MFVCIILFSVSGILPSIISSFWLPLCFVLGKVLSPPIVSHHGSQQRLHAVPAASSSASLRGDNPSRKVPTSLHGTKVPVSSRQGQSSSQSGHCSVRPLKRLKLDEQEITRIKKKKLAQFVKSKYSSKVFKFRKKEVHKTLMEKQTIYKCRYCSCSFTSRIGRRIHEEIHANSKYDPS